MNFELKLAWKYFRARRKSLARLTAFVAVVGIAVGVASLIAAQSLARGFQDEMRDKILANNAHVAVSLVNGAEIENWREIIKQFETGENVSRIEPTAFASAIIIAQTETSYALLKVRNSIENGNPRVSVGAAAKNSDITIGAKLAEKLNLKSGDAAEILTIDNQTPVRVRVAETFETGLYDYDAAWIYVSPEFFASLHQRRDFVPEVLNVSVKDIFKADATAREMRAKLGENFKIIDWQQANKPLFAALSLERKVSLAIISLIVFVAVLNITTTLSLLAGERKLDIAVLQTCGAKKKSLLLIFLLEGLFLGLIGVTVGVIAGLTICAAGNYFKIINLSAEVYALNYIPFHPNLMNVLLISLIALALSLIAAAFPAYRASRVKPLENLRNQ